MVTRDRRRPFPQRYHPSHSTLVFLLIVVLQLLGAAANNTTAAPAPNTTEATNVTTTAAPPPVTSVPPTTTASPENTTTASPENATEAPATPVPGTPVPATPTPATPTPATPVPAPVTPRPAPGDRTETPTIVPGYWWPVTIRGVRVTIHPANGASVQAYHNTRLSEDSIVTNTSTGAFVSQPASTFVKVEFTQTVYAYTYHGERLRTISETSSPGRGFIVRLFATNNDNYWFGEGPNTFSSYDGLSSLTSAFPDGIPGTVELKGSVSRSNTDGIAQFPDLESSECLNNYKLLGIVETASLQELFGFTVQEFIIAEPVPRLSVVAQRSTCLPFVSEKSIVDMLFEPIIRDINITDAEGNITTVQRVTGVAKRTTPKADVEFTARVGEDVSSLFALMQDTCGVPLRGVAVISSKAIPSQDRIIAVGQADPTEWLSTGVTSLEPDGSGGFTGEHLQRTTSLSSASMPFNISEVTNITALSTTVFSVSVVGGEVVEFSDFTVPLNLSWVDPSAAFHIDFYEANELPLETFPNGTIIQQDLRSWLTTSPKGSPCGAVEFPLRIEEPSGSQFVPLRIDIPDLNAKEISENGAVIRITALVDAFPAEFGGATESSYYPTSAANNLDPEDPAAAAAARVYASVVDENVVRSTFSFSSTVSENRAPRGFLYNVGAGKVKVQKRRRLNRTQYESWAAAQPPSPPISTDTPAPTADPTRWLIDQEAHMKQNITEVFIVDVLLESNSLYFTNLDEIVTMRINSRFLRAPFYANTSAIAFEVTPFQIASSTLARRWIGLIGMFGNMINIGTMSVIRHVGSCTVDEGAQLDFVLHPMTISITSDAQKYFIGALVCNLSLITVFTLVYALISKKIMKEDSLFPHLSLRLSYLLYPGNILAAASVVLSVSLPTFTFYFLIVLGLAVAVFYPAAFFIMSRLQRAAWVPVRINPEEEQASDTNLLDFYGVHEFKVIQEQRKREELRAFATKKRMEQDAGIITGSFAGKDGELLDENEEEQRIIQSHGARVEATFGGGIFARSLAKFVASDGKYRFTHADNLRYRSTYQNYRGPAATFGTMELVFVLLCACCTWFPCPVNTVGIILLLCAHLIVTFIWHPYFSVARNCFALCVDVLFLVATITYFRGKERSSASIFDSADFLASSLNTIGLIWDIWSSLTLRRMVQFFQYRGILLCIMNPWGKHLDSLQSINPDAEFEVLERKRRQRADEEDQRRRDRQVEEQKKFIEDLRSRDPATLTETERHELDAANAERDAERLRAEAELQLEAEEAEREAAIVPIRYARKRGESAATGISPEGNGVLEQPLLAQGDPESNSTGDTLGAGSPGGVDLSAIAAQSPGASTAADPTPRPDSRRQAANHRDPLESSSDDEHTRIFNELITGHRKAKERKQREAWKAALQDHRDRMRAIGYDDFEENTQFEAWELESEASNGSLRHDGSSSTFHRESSAGSLRRDGSMRGKGRRGRSEFADWGRDEQAEKEREIALENETEMDLFLTHTQQMQRLAMEEQRLKDQMIAEEMAREEELWREHKTGRRRLGVSDSQTVVTRLYITPEGVQEVRKRRPKATGEEKTKEEAAVLLKQERMASLGLNADEINNADMDERVKMRQAMDQDAEMHDKNEGPRLEKGPSRHITFRKKPSKPGSLLSRLQSSSQRQPGSAQSSGLTPFEYEVL